MEIAYRTFGSGDPILFLHGWPLSGFTWRKVVPQLAAQFTCVVVDLPGAGATRWRPDNDFSFSGQARNLVRFVEKLGLERLHIVAHDTGATIGRALALLAPERTRTMTLIGTEIPGHRPPWIPLFQRTVGLPGSAAIFALLLRSRAFTRSAMGFGNVFADCRGFHVVPDAKLLVHEEQPGIVARHVLDFLREIA